MLRETGITAVLPQWGVLFIDAEGITGSSSLWGFPGFWQVQSAHPEFTDVSLALISALERLWPCSQLFLFPRPPRPCLGEWALLVLGLARAHHLRACFLVDLLALLKWKAFPDRIMDILGRLRHVSGEEIVKVWLPSNGPVLCAACVL